MKIQLIRNASLKIWINNKVILVDPMLGDKFSIPSFGGKSKNPLVDLPLAIEEVLEGLDAVLITHLHQDHWDEKAWEIIPKDTTIFCQPGDLEKIKAQGFHTIISIDGSLNFEGLNITRTKAQHGSGKILELMGEASGYILAANGEPTIYIVGDSILIPEITSYIDQHNPDVVLTNSGGAIMPGYEKTPILMDATQTADLADYCSPKLLVTCHLEALDHCKVSREELNLLGSVKESRNIFVPFDGDVMDFGV
jgi:L-ascorbate metabolism protein UlaG (beta-lactamase superfamily)